MMRHVTFDRAPAGDALDGIVAWFWSVAWAMPDGATHDQVVLNHPAGNVSIGTVDDDAALLDPAEGRVYGVPTRASTRHLAGRGWTVAARTTVGGLGLLVGASASDYTDGRRTLSGGVPGLDADRVLDRVRTADDNADRIALLRDGLADAVSRRSPKDLAECRDVVAMAALAEHDRSICRLEQLAGAAAVSARTLQRLFDRHVGVSPSFVIRRWRIIEAAEAARLAIDDDTDWPGWAAVAARLGYADQAHLTRDFRRHLGTTPSAYLSRATPERGPNRR